MSLRMEETNYPMHPDAREVKILRIIEYTESENREREAAYISEIFVNAQTVSEEGSCGLFSHYRLKFFTFSNKERKMNVTYLDLNTLEEAKAAAIRELRF